LLVLFIFVGNRINQASAAKRSKKEQKKKTTQCATGSWSTAWPLPRAPARNWWWGLPSRRLDGHGRRWL